MQTYQEVTKEIVKELKNMTVNKHLYFYKLKQEQPERFDRLMFDTNGHSPYSKELSDIFTDLINSGK